VAQPDHRADSSPGVLARALGEGWRRAKDGRNQVCQGPSLLLRQPQDSRARSVASFRMTSKSLISTIQYTIAEGIVDPAGCVQMLPRYAGLRRDRQALLEPFSRKLPVLMGLLAVRYNRGCAVLRSVCQSPPVSTR
jgi:hypothetical protein